MTSRFLLARTPRAGLKNIRYLISPGAELSEATVLSQAREAEAQFVDSSDEVIGSNFLAVRRRNVRQEVGGREDDELLILGGLCTKQVNLRQRFWLGTLKERLVSRDSFDSLEGLIARLDWDSESGLVLENEQLGIWLNKYFSLPSGDLSSRWRSPIWLTVCSLLGIFVIFICWKFDRLPRLLKGSPISPVLGQSGAEGNNSQFSSKEQENGLQLFKTTLVSLGIPSNKDKEARQDLANITNIGEQKLFEDRTIRQLLQDLNLKDQETTADRVSPFRYVYNPNKLEIFWKQQQTEVVATRRSLHNISSSVKTYRKKVKQECTSIPNNLEQYPHLGWAIALAKTNAIAPEGEQTEPLFPLFATTEVEMFEFLDEVFKEAKEKQKLGYNENFRLDTYLDYLRDKRTDMEEKITSEYRKWKRSDSSTVETQESIRELESLARDLLDNISDDRAPSR